MNSTTDNALLESACRFTQECLSLAPVIILGSGHSCEFNIPGMTQLAEFLCSEVPKEIETNDKDTWKEFEDKIRLLPLEAALQETRISQALANLINRKTWDYISPYDRDALINIIQNRNSAQIPLSRLFRHLFDSTHSRIQLITTNYDCIAEYAIESVGYAWATGFGYGYIGNRYNNQRLVISRGSTAFRMIDIWKVHGSLNWYRAPDGTTYCLPSVHEIPNNYSPVIVTPGVDKYRRTHEEPFRTIIAGADMAIEGGKSFLCIGYGFNDEHIQPKLLQKCKREGKAIVVLAKELTDAARNVLLDGSCRHFIAFERTTNGTRVFTPKHLTGVELTEINLWSLGNLLDQVL